MHVFHDSRNVSYRAPYGAVAVNTPIDLRIDVYDAPNAKATLRTWVNGVGEARYEMRSVAAESSDRMTRYQCTLTPEAVGIVWYHFIIVDEFGNEKRYGARDGRFGGEGELRDWEPPSFLLTVLSAEDLLSPGSGSHSAYGVQGELGHAFVDALVGYLRNEKTAFDLAECIEATRENSPVSAYRDAFDLMAGSTPVQLLEWLGGLDRASAHDETRVWDDRKAHEAIDDGSQLAASCATTRLSGGQLGLAKGRLWCACLVQMLLPDTPAGYETEASCAEAILQWSAVDPDCGVIARNAIDIRHALPLFAGGYVSCIAINDDVLGFWRRGEDGAIACILINASLRDAHDVLVPFADEDVSEIIAGYEMPVVDAADAKGRACMVPLPGVKDFGRFAAVHLHQLGSAIAYFHPKQQLDLPMEEGLGVLAHITSLPAEGPGAIGASARAFVDWLADAGMRYWQILPVNPTDEFGSPYAGISAFAGNVRLLEDGEKVGAEAEELPDEYQAFCEREADWLEPYACFMAIREKRRKGAMWQAWPKKYRHFDPAIVSGDADLSQRAETWRRAQFSFECQWKALRSYANERGVQIIGDMPIYVSADSVDVWATPEIFQLDSNGLPAVVAGCPPDRFAEEGQIWGNPVYNWDVLKDAGYDWWLRRLKRAFELYDWVRLDHFIGFSRYFSIPADGTAKEGAYHDGPGLDFFRAAYDAFGPLPIVAEDLGSITPAVRGLSAACGFLGMDIVQFVDGNDPLSGYRPRPAKIAYTGTHDNQTLVGYCADRYPDLDAREAAEKIANTVATCGASVRVFPLQDVIGLDDGARMNVPGVAEGNWAWQADAADMKQALERAKTLVRLGR